MVSRPNPYETTLMRWLRDRKCWMGSVDTRVATHLFLSPPGKACIPPDLTDEFEGAYATYLCTTSTPCFGIVQVHGAEFYLHMDLDFKVADPGSIQTDALLRSVFEAVKSVLPGATEMVVCTAEPYALLGGLSKVGFHLHWPGTQPVGLRTAMECRAACLEAVGRAGLEVPSGGWDDVFDRAVFRTGTGLRMLGSTKGTGTPVANVYMPSLVVQEDGTVPVDKPYAQDARGCADPRGTRGARDGPRGHLRGPYKQLRGLRHSRCLARQPGRQRSAGRVHPGLHCRQICRV